jgi:hypothetical protein
MKNLLLIFVLLFNGLVFNGCFSSEEKVEEVPKYLQMSRAAKERQKKRNLKTSSDWDREYWVRDNKTKKDKK